MIDGKFATEGDIVDYVTKRSRIVHGSDASSGHFDAQVVVRHNTRFDPQICGVTLRKKADAQVVFGGAVADGHCRPTGQHTVVCIHFHPAAVDGDCECEGAVGVNAFLAGLAGDRIANRHNGGRRRDQIDVIQGKSAHDTAFDVQSRR